MILLYTMSSVYHGLKPGLGKRVMQVFDHCTIYVLIAGTYTPLLLSAMRPIDPVASWVLLGIVWGLAAVGIAVTAIDLNKYKVFSMVCYMAIGWCIVFKLPLLIQAIGWGGFWLILGGGLLYTVGAVLYGKGKTKPFMHCVFHVFVILGSVCHVLAILLFAKLATSYLDYRKHGQFEWAAPAILFGCLLFSLTAPLYLWSIVGI